MKVTEFPVLNLSLKGQPHWIGPVHQVIEISARDALLLALLAVEGPQPRARLAHLLWPDSSAEAARNTLRQRLFTVRKQCGHPVVVGGATLALAQDVSHDLSETSGLLGHLELPECPEINMWLRHQRQRRQIRQRQALEARMDAFETEGDFTAALSQAHHLLQLDPLSEDAHRRLMRLHYLRGDRAAALLAFDHCAQTLKDEIDAAPSDQTMQLLDAIQKAQAPLALTPRRQVPTSVLRPPRMIGREAQRQRILQDLDSGQVAVIVGEAGMGKSRMLAELGAELGVNSGGFICAAARPGDAGVPFSSLARLLRELVRHCPDALARVPRNELARFMPELGTPAQGAADRQRLIFEQAVSALIVAARADIQALGFDDLHFADEASLDMLQAITAANQELSMRWILALRPAEATSRTSALLDALAEAGRLGNATLQPLSAVELGDLVDSLGVPGLHGAALATQLHQQSGGNPLFALETIKRLLIDELITVPSSAGTHAGSGSQDAVSVISTLPRPASVLTLIERRLGHLSAGALAVARVAAVASSDFSIEVAQFVLEQPALLLSDAWTELERAQVLRDSAFAHDLVFEAVLRSIPTPIARHTHGRVAQYLAQQHGEAARIAAHYLAAEQSQEALPWLKQAATTAGLALRTKEQMDFLLQAAQIYENAGQMHEAFEALREALEVEGKAGTSLDMAQSARLEALAQTPHQIAQACNVRMHQFGGLFRFSEAEEAGRRALALADVAVDADLYHDIRQFWGTMLGFLGRNQEALDAMLPLQEWMDSHASPGVRGEYHANLACVLDNLGRLDEAVRHHLLAAKISRSLNAWYQAASGLGNLAINRLDAGDMDAAQQHLEEAEQLYTLFEGGESPTGYSAITFSICKRVKGRFKEALHWADAVMERSPDVPLVIAAGHLKQVEVWNDLGQHARVLRQLDKLASQPEWPFSIQISICCSQAQAKRMQNDKTYASLLDQAMGLLPEDTRPDLRHRIMLMRVLLEPPLQVLALTERVIEEAKAIGHQGTVMAAWARRAGCLWRHDPALALDAAQRALELAKTVDSSMLYRPELWLNAAQAMRACGLQDQAQQQVSLARNWIMNCIRSGQVPEPFVESFLQRNPINRELLAWPLADRS